MTATFTRSSDLKAAAPVVWRSATSMDGINRELRPWMSMSVPPEMAGLTLDDDRVVLGQPLFVSGVRILGIPMERMHVTLVELERGRRFVEESPMRAMRRWRHERTVEPAGDGCTLTDTITFEPRLGFTAAMTKRALEAFFAHRHRQLAKLFG